MSQAAIEFTDEEWRDIPGFPNHQASSLGRIRSKKLLKPTYGYKNNKGYLMYKMTIGTFRKTVTVHKCILLAFQGYPKQGYQCDHINRNKTDNRIKNLRWVTASENCLNRSTYGQSKFRGVYFAYCKNKKKDGTISISKQIKAGIAVNKQKIKLGNFKTEEEAHQAYLTAFKEYYGYDCPI